MVNLIFKGSRLDYLMTQKPAYEEAVANGTVNDFVDIVYGRYARRYPIDLALTDEPSLEFLAEVDDEAPDPEREPLHEDLSDEELAVEEMKIKERQAKIQKRKKQVAGWFGYRHMKDHNLDPSSTDPSNPFTAVLFTLTGKHSKEKPRQKSAVNCWSKTKATSEIITKLVRQACIRENIARKRGVAVWNRVAREQFALLDEEDQAHWEEKAKQDHLVDLAQWKAVTEGIISTTPEARQRCIEGFVRFGQSIIEAMADATGMKIALFAGGPEPADEGRLNIISLHAGTNNNEAPLNFGQAERANIVKYFIPIFSKYLKSCYTPEDCRKRALVSLKGVVALDDAKLEAMGGSLDDVSIAALLPEPDDNNGDLFLLGTALTPSQTVASRPMTPSRGQQATVSQLPPSQPTTPDVGVPAISQLPAPRPCTPRSPTLPIRSCPVSPLGSPFRSPTRRELSLSPISTPQPMDIAPDSPRPPVQALGATVVTTGTDCTSAEDPHPTETRRTSTRKRQAKHIDPPAKRGRFVMVASVSATITPAPSEAPSSTVISGPPTAAALQASHKWFARAIEMLSDDGLGEQWMKLVSAWVEFEVKFECKPNGLLACNGRPAAVGDWIARARNPSWRPDIVDSKIYGDAHVEWWSNIQPGWRVLDDGVFDGVDGGDLRCLQKPGANGLLSVQASLLFWGTAVKASGKKSKRWIEHVADCTRVLERLVSAA